MSTSKPSILLIPGASGLPEFYDIVINPVAAQGYEIRALHIPTVGLKPGSQDHAPSTMYDDASFVAKEVEKLAGQGKDVVLIAHSYGGVVLSQCTKGLGKEERKAQGKKGGIVRMAYMTCLVPEVGQTAGGMLAEVKEEHRMLFKLDDKGWFHQESIQRAAPIVFSDLPVTEAVGLMEKFPPHSAACYANELTYAGYKDIPVSYLVCEGDLVIPVEAQRLGIEMIERVSGKKVDVTSIQTDHIPSTSHPQKVIDWIMSVVMKA